MTNRDEGRPAGDEVTTGVPATQDIPPAEFRTGEWGAAEDESPMPDEPMGVDEYGTTVAEERVPESFEDRSMRLEPEFGDGDGADDDIPAEEAAMHVVDDDLAPGLTYDASPDYVGDEPPGAYRGEEPAAP